MISDDKDEPDWMLERRLRALEQYQNMPMPSDWPGMPDLSELDVEEIIPYPARTSTSARRRRLDGAARRDQGHLRQTGHSGSREERTLRRRCPVRVRGRLPEHAGAVGGEGRHLLQHGQGRSGAPRNPQRALHDDLRAAKRQQVRGAARSRLVRRIVRLRPGGRHRRDASAGLLPDELGRDGPVRAHAHHRRGRL